MVRGPYSVEERRMSPAMDIDWFTLRGVCVGDGRGEGLVRIDEYMYICIYGLVEDTVSWCWTGWKASVMMAIYHDASSIIMHHRRTPRTRSSRWVTNDLDARCV